MTGKTRMLGAGRAGSTSYGSNVNLVQFGNKLQGLAPQATHFFIAGNGPAGWVNYQTRTYAPKRNFVFCMNRLGGVGRGKSQFKIGGLNNPDGSRSCKPYDYIKQKETFEEKNIITKKLSNKLEKDSDNNLVLITDSSENKGKIDSSDDSIPERFSSIEAVYTFSETLPFDNPPFPTHTNGGIFRIITTYPLNDDEIIYLKNYIIKNSKFQIEENNIWTYKDGDCYAGAGFAYSSSTTYVKINYSFIAKVDVFQMPLPLDCVFIEYSPYETSTQWNSLYLPKYYYNTNTEKVEKNLFIPNGDTIYSLSNSIGQTWLDNTKIDIVDLLQEAASSAIIQSFEYSKPLDIYKLDQKESLLVEGEGLLTDGGCLLTYLYADTSSIDFQTLKITVDLGMERTIDVLDPYISLVYSDNNTGSSSISLNYIDPSGSNVPICGNPMCYDINLLILKFINDLPNISTTPSIFFTTNKDLFNEALDKMPYGQTNPYNLPPLINVDGIIYPLLFNGSDQQYAMVLRFRNSSSNLDAKMRDLPCYPDENSNLPVTEQVDEWISVLYN